MSVRVGKALRTASFRDERLFGRRSGQVSGMEPRGAVPCQTVTRFSRAQLIKEGLTSAEQRQPPTGALKLAVGARRPHSSSASSAASPRSYSVKSKDLRVFSAYPLAPLLHSLWRYLSGLTGPDSRPRDPRDGDGKPPRSLAHASCSLTSGEPRPASGERRPDGVRRASRSGSTSMCPALELGDRGRVGRTPSPMKPPRLVPSVIGDHRRTRS